LCAVTPFSTSNSSFRPVPQPYDQIREQLRLIIELVKERQESEIINNANYGLLKNVAPEGRIKTRTGRHADDLDELITRYGKSPLSSWLTLAPSLHLAANARAAACLLRR